MKARLAKKILMRPMDRVSPYWVERWASRDHRIVQAKRRTKKLRLREGTIWDETQYAMDIYYGKI